MDGKIVEAYDALIRDARGDLMDARTVSYGVAVILIDKALSKVVQARTLLLKHG